MQVLPPSPSWDFRMVKRHFRKITRNGSSSIRIFGGFQMPKPELGLVELERAKELRKGIPGTLQTNRTFAPEKWRVDWKTTDIYKLLLGF